MFRQDFTCPALLEHILTRLPIRGYHPLWPAFPHRFSYVLNMNDKSHWPSPRSLATTNGVSFDVLSSGYLDVSVPRVRLLILCIQIRIPHTWWVSPFGYSRIKAYCQLPVTFRRLSRPSSPLSAKASTERPYQRLIHCSFQDLSTSKTTFLTTIRHKLLQVHI